MAESKAQMGKMLSQQLREIGNEETEFLKSGDGDDKMISKIEMLARKVWAMALGKEAKGSCLESGVPNASAASTIFDRLEGKAKPTSEDPGKKKLTVSDRVTEESKKRLNDI